MPDFNIRIKVDPSTATPTVDDFGAKLRATEQTANAIGPAIESSMRQGSLSADRAKESAGGLADSLKRQQDILEKIEGPAREYRANMDALDALYRRNMISADQYREQVEKLGQSLAKSKGAGGGEGEGFKVEGVGQAVAGQFGAAGNLLGGVATGALEAAGVVELGKSLIELGDDYTMLHNKALELAGGTRSMNDVIGEQLGLAGTLHSSLEQTIELSTVVKQRFDDLNLTSEQQARIAQSVGEAAIYSGQSLSAASDVINRVTFAFEAGIPAGRQMRDLFREYPLLADAMRDHFHASTASIIDMANKGKISAQDFADAMIRSGDEIDAKYAAVGETIGQKLSHAWDVAKAHMFGLADLADLILGIDKVEEEIAALNAQTEGVKKLTDEMMSNVEAVHRLEEANSELALAYQKTKDAADGATKIIDEQSKKYTDAVGKVDAYKEAITRIRQDFAEMNVLRRAHGEAAISMHDFITGSDVTIVNEYLKAQQALSDSTSKFSDVVTPIHQKELERSQAIERLKEALHAGAINQTEFNEAMKQYVHISEAAKQADEARARLFHDSLLSGQAQRINRRQGGFDPQLDVTVDEVKPIQKDVDQDRAVELYNKTRTAAEKYSDELAEVNRLYAEDKLNATAYARIVDDIGTRYGKVTTNAEQYAKAVKTLDEELKVHLITQDSYQKQLDALSIKFNQGGLGAGFRTGLDQIKQSINPALDAQKLLGDGFNNIRDSITGLVTTGNLDFSKFVNGLLSDAVRLGEDQFLKQLFNLGGDAAGGGATSAASAALSAIGGGASGGDFDIPHAASGGAWLVRHQSGEDTHVAAFHVRAGEHIAIRTPEQQAAAARGGGSSSTPVVVRPVIQNVMESGRQLLEHSRGPEGAQVVLNHIGANRATVKALLGIK